MVRIVWSLLLLLAGNTVASAELPSDPTLQELQAIAARPHSDNLTSKPLEIYPQARSYQISVTVHAADQEQKTFEIEAREKWVDGQYIVSNFQLPESDVALTMVVTYDQQQKCYRKWVYSATAFGDIMAGTRLGDSRTVSWTSLAGPQEGRPRIVSQETHTDTTTEWQELHFHNNKVLVRIHGKAKAKPVSDSRAD